MEYNPILNDLFQSSTMGFSKLQVIPDATGAPCDYLFVDLNESFASQWGSAKITLLNNTIKTVFPTLIPSLTELFNIINQVSFQGGENELVFFFEPHRRWLFIHVSSPSLLHVHLISFDITPIIYNQQINADVAKKFQIQSENSSDILWILNFSTQTYEYISQSIFPFRGLTVEEAKKESLQDALTHDSYMQMQSDIDQLLSTYRMSGEIPPTYVVEVQQPCKDGTLIWVEISCNFNLNEKNEIMVYGLSRNIQRRKTTEIALKRSEEKYRKLIENSQDIIYTVLIDGEIVFVSPSFTHQLGYPLSEVVGSSIKKFVYSTDIPAFEVMLSEINLIRTFNESYEFRVTDINGNIHWLSTTFNTIKGPEGNIVALDGIARNITLKRTNDEEINKLSQVVEQSPNMILITSLDGIIEYVNAAYCQISGFSKVEMIGKMCLLFAASLDREEKDFEQFWETVNAGVIWRGEWLDKKKSGELYWVGVTVNPILNKKKEATHYVLIMQDITDRKKVEEELLELNLNLERKVEERTAELTLTNEYLMNEVFWRKQNEVEIKNARDEAERANKAKSEFISRMSHELRTPLNAILGFAQLLEMGEVNKNQLNSVKHILKSGKHLLNLINEILDISQIEAGKFTLHPNQHNFKHLVDEAMDLVRPIATENEILLHNNTDNLSEIMVFVDKQKLVQVLVNLLNNAIKYNVKGGFVQLTVDLPPNTITERAFLRINIKDTGMGVAHDDIARMFNPFERIHSTTSAIEGTGLGLPIAKEMVASMEGKIEVESTVGIGSVFMILLPAKIIVFP